ncbi:MAG: DUF3769 domain-containing protein [Spirulina sp.]
MPLPLLLPDLPPAIAPQALVHQAPSAADPALQFPPAPLTQPGRNPVFLVQSPAPSAQPLNEAPAPHPLFSPAQPSPEDSRSPLPAAEGAEASPTTDSPAEAPPETDPQSDDQGLGEDESGAITASFPWRDGGVSAQRQVIADSPVEVVAPDVAERPLAAEDPAVAPETEPLDPTLLRLLADAQTYEPARQVVTASGDVLVQFGDAQLAADRLWVNLNNRHLRAEGNVFFNRNQQVLEGDAATYNLLQGSGRLTNGRGSLRIATIADDFSVDNFPTDAALLPVDYRLQGQGSISQVTSPGGYSFALSPTASIFGGERTDVGRLRFETSDLYFNADGWYGENLRLTNDPFSPPELELRGNRVSFVPISEEEDELCVDNPRLVFDQWLSVPLVRRCFQLQNGQLPDNTFNPFPTSFGYDNRDRDGFFVERRFPVVEAGNFRLSLAPQFYISRWLGENSSGLFDAANFGLVARARGAVGPRTFVSGLVSLPGLDLQNFTDRVRANLRVQQAVGTHRLSAEYTYRDRLFNGSLGFQDVQTSAGLLLESPVIPLGNTGINLTYQLSGQYVNALTDQADLLDPGVGVGLASLFRFQGAIDLSRSFSLWQGTAKPSTPTEGLRYSPRPVVPFLALVAGLRGVATYYTSNDLQETLDARITLVGQLGHFSRNYFDYTQFNLGLSSSFIGGDGSPFFFDRLVDQNTLSGGIVQQIYGPLLLGFQTSFNLDTGREIDTSFSVEYRRRTYGLVAQYSPTQETGFFGFRLSQFDWVGRPDPFDGEATNQDVQVQ